MKPYIRYRNTLFPVRELLAEVLCTAAFVFAMGVIVGACTMMLDDFSQSEATLDSLQRTAEEP